MFLTRKQKEWERKKNALKHDILRMSANKSAKAQDVWGRDKNAAISETFWNGFSWKKYMYFY